LRAFLFLCAGAFDCRVSLPPVPGWLRHGRRVRGYHDAMQQEDRQPMQPPGAAGGAAAEGTARFVILGQTSTGKTFRPSDWAERLAGVMAAFRPRKAGSQQHLTYSPYVLPSSHRGIKCVIVDPRLKEIEPLAYSFMLKFASDNDLVTEALPSPA
jgi:hypothetical protein